MTIRPVADDQWQVVAWLWQAFRQDRRVFTAAYGDAWVETE